MAAAVARGDVHIKDGLYLFATNTAKEETKCCRSDTFGRSQARSSTDIDTFAGGIESSNGGGSGDSSSQQEQLLGFPAPPAPLNMITLYEKRNRLARRHRVAEEVVRDCMSAGIDCTRGERALQKLSLIMKTVEKMLGEVSFILVFHKEKDGVAMTQEKVVEFEDALDHLDDCLARDACSARGYVPKLGKK